MIFTLLAKIFPFTLCRIDVQGMGEYVTRSFSP
jgi:hypothetical protein